MSNVSSVTNLISTANEGFATTVASPGVTSGGTTVPLASVSGLTNGTVFVGIVEPGRTTEQTFTGTVDTANSQIINVVWTRGTNAAHAAGVTVVDYVTGTAHNMMAKHILEEHSQDGSHADVTTDTLSNAGTLTQTGVATFSTHIDVNDSSTAVRDSSDNELLKFSKTASAVNEITIANAATANGPEIQATGGDTDINIELIPKGAGKLTVGGVPFDHGDWATWTPSYTNFTPGNGTLNWARYTQIGNTVHFTYSFTIGSTSSMGTAPQFSFPVTAAPNQAELGMAYYADISASGIVYGGYIAHASNTTFIPLTWTAGGTYAAGAVWGSGIPVALGAGDTIRFQGTYEAA